jgi:general secretion pathway protein C
MKRLFKPERIRQAIIILAVIAVIKLVWVSMEVVWLSTSGVDHAEESRVKNLYYRVDFVSTKVIKPTPVKAKENIKDIKLIAIYSASDAAVVTVEFKRKTSILMIGDTINGFVLEGAGKDFATFNKNSKLYTLKLIKEKRSNGSSIKIRPVMRSTHKEQNSAVTGKIIDAGDHKIIEKSLLRHYTSDMDKIFKEIGIQDMRKNGKIEGFRVRYIKKGSHFDQLGLQRGDIIKSVNGEKMDSEKAAFDIYKNIKDITNLTLVIQRGNQEMELEYEIN